MPRDATYAEKQWQVDKDWFFANQERLAKQYGEKAFVAICRNTVIAHGSDDKIVRERVQELHENGRIVPFDRVLIDQLGKHFDLGHDQEPTIRGHGISLR